MILDLIRLADSLDKYGFHNEAAEIDSMVKYAASTRWGQQLLDMLEDKDNFTKEEISELISTVENLMQEQDTSSLEKAKDSARNIAEGIKEMVSSIPQLLSSGNTKAYEEDIRKLSNLLSIVSRMEQGGRENDTNDIENIYEIATPEVIEKGKELLQRYVSENESLTTDSVISSFNSMASTINEIKDQRKLISEYMNRERYEAEEAGETYDPKSSEYRDQLQHLSQLDERIKEQARNVMSDFKMFYVVNPDDAQAMIEQLGNSYYIVQDTARSDEGRMQ